MPRRWPVVIRIVVSSVFVTLLLWPFADYTWTLFDVRPYDPVTGANPIYVSCPVSDVTAPIANHTWRVCIALPEAVLGALLAIGIFLLLGRLGKTPCHETRCRRCKQVLRALTDPTCPACGEHL